MWAYSGKDQKAFVDAVGHGATRNMLRRIDAAPPSPDMLKAAAEVVGWSQEFALHGAGAIAPAEETLDERVQALEDRLRALTNALGSARRGDPLEQIAQAVQAATEAGQETRPGRGASAASDDAQDRQRRAPGAGDA